MCESLNTGGLSSASTYVVLGAGTRVRLRERLDIGVNLGTQVVFGSLAVGTLAEADIKLKAGRLDKSPQKGWLRKDVQNVTGRGTWEDTQGKKSESRELETKNRVGKHPLASAFCRILHEVQQPSGHHLLSTSCICSAVLGSRGQAGGDSGESNMSSCFLFPHAQRPCSEGSRRNKTWSTP